MSIHIALLGPANLRYVREVFLGVSEYVKAHPSWQLRLEMLSGKFGPRLAQWRADAVIVMFEQYDQIDALLASVHCPVINIGDPITSFACPVVRSDDAAIGVMAAKHFLERGFTRFGFAPYVVERAYFSRSREAAFRNAVQGHSYSCGPGGDDENALVEWLRALPKPCGILAANDHQAHDVAEAAHNAGIRIPEDVALIGVDNDELICSISAPTLSSLDPGSRAVGWEAARQVGLMLGGEPGPPPNEPVVVPPVGIIVRASSDTLAIEDLDVADAARFIRANAHLPLSVSDVLREVPISRRAMERRFRAVFGHGPADEIRRLRVQRARDLLATTDLPMPKIATACGFASAVQLSIVFRRMTKQTPTDYRRRFSTGGRPGAMMPDSDASE